MTLTPGVYCYTSAGPAAQLTGTLTLDAQGSPNAVFLFQISSTLTTASNSTVLFSGGGQGGSVYWQVGSSATLGTGTAFAGNILALTSITLTTGATMDCGRALAINGAVTLDSNSISTGSAGCLSSNAATVPEPSGAALFLVIGVPLLLWLKRVRSNRQVLSKI